MLSLLAGVSIILPHVVFRAALAGVRRQGVSEPPGRAGQEERAAEAGAAGGLRHHAAAGRGRLVPVPHAEVPRPQQRGAGDAGHLLPVRMGHDVAHGNGWPAAYRATGERTWTSACAYRNKEGAL